MVERTAQEGSEPAPDRRDEPVPGPVGGAPVVDGQVGDGRVGDGRTDDDDGPEPAVRRRRRGEGSLLVELPVILVTALVLSLIIKTFLVQAFYIPSGSMESTLLVGDRVLVNKLSTRIGSIRRGDVVVFRDPGGWLADQPAQGDDSLAHKIRSGLVFVGLAPSDVGDDLIKRVIGVAGDRVVCCDKRGRITVNGTPLTETYLYADNVPSEERFAVTVPPRSLWVMGDHRAASEDSRAHRDLPTKGFVPLDDVVGRAVVIVWPLDRASRLTRPDTYDAPDLDRR